MSAHDHASHDYNDPSAPPRLCENCQTPLRGPYCSACGQHDFDVHRSFRHVFHEALESFFHFDGKFFSSIVDLLFHPGRLTVAFNAGKRVSQVPPLRFYVFVSLLFFVWVSFTHDAGNAIDLGDTDRAAKPGWTVKRDGDDEPNPASPAAKPQDEPATLSSIGSAKEEGSPAHPGLGDGGATAGPAEPTPPQLIADETARAKAAPTAAGQEHAPDSITYEAGKWIWHDQPGNAEKSKWGRLLVDKLNHRREIGEAFVHFIPKMLLVCLPLFALLTRVLFRRSGLVYLQHLVLALHVHTFAYLYWMFVEGWQKIVGLFSSGLGQVIALLAALYAFAYFYLTLKRVFRESGLRTFFKSGLLFFGYWLTLAFASLVTIGIAVLLV